MSRLQPAAAGFVIKGAGLAAGFVCNFANVLILQQARVVFIRFVTFRTMSSVFL
jgi:hypothetical protein